MVTDTIPLERFIAPARQSTGWWRPVLGLAIILGLWVFGSIVVIAGWVVHRVDQGDGLDTAMSGLEDLANGGSAGKVIVMLLTFVGVWIGCWMATEIVHRQRFMTLLEATGRILSRAFLRGVVLALGFSLLTTCGALLLIEVPVLSVDPVNWAMLLVPLAVLVFVQATAEELVFRGYLLQQLAIRFRSAVIWGVVPSLLFGALHYRENLLVETSLGTSFELAGFTLSIAGLYYVAITFLTGLVFVALVWRTGSLWMAAGLHVGINTFSLCGIGAEGLLSGTQLFLYSHDSIGYLLELDLISVSILLVLVLGPVGQKICPSDHRAAPA